MLEKTIEGRKPEKYGYRNGNYPSQVFELLTLINQIPTHSLVINLKEEENPPPPANQIRQKWSSFGGAAFVCCYWLPLLWSLVLSISVGVSELSEFLVGFFLLLLLPLSSLRSFLSSLISEFVVWAFIV